MINNYKTVYVGIIFFVVSTLIKAQCTFTTVPYYENFSSISSNNQLPNCWAASNMSATCLTYTSALNQNRVPCSPSCFASFSNSLGAHYFYTRGLYLNAGITYSTSLWYLTEYYGYTNWTDLSILYGSAQSSVGLTSIVSSNGPALSPICKSLSGTFSVSTSGVYFVAIRATSNGAAGASYLSWDDFLIDIPCQLNSNNFTVSASSNTICLGQTTTLTAGGNNSTLYSWSNGATGSLTVVSPNANNMYYAIGSNTATSCITTKSITIYVNPTPIVSIFSNSASICSGNTVALLGFGASTYSWSTGASTNTILVSPSVATSYTVVGTNSFNCSSSAVQQINVMPSPTITAIPSITFICVSDEVKITLSGADNYLWSSTTSTTSGINNPIIKQFAANENLIITGTNANGCSKTLTLNLNVNGCAGLNEKSLEKRLYLFPNPTVDEINLIGLTNNSTIEMYDLKGALVYTKNTTERRLTIDLRQLDKGLYLMRIQSGNETVEKKIIKD